MGDGVNRRAGVDAGQTLAQLFGLTGDVGFGQQNTVGVANLRLGNGELVHLLVGVHRVDQRNYAIQQIAFTQHLVGEKGLDDGAGVGHTGAFNHQAVETDVALVEVIEQV